MAEWLIDEDAELLGATLSLVAAWGKQEELSSSGSASGNDASNPQSPDESVGDAVPVSTLTLSATPPHRKTGKPLETVVRTEKPTPPRRGQHINLSRERRKTEIETLRTESDTLESQLQTLQRRREDILRPHYNGNAIKTTAPVWENLARRQLQSRKRAEEYNERLKAKVADQALVAQGLMAAIQTATQCQVMREEIRRVRLPIDVSQSLSEEQQLARLCANAPRWKWALSLSPKFQRGELEFLDFHIVDAHEQSVTMDLYKSKVLPYSVASVARVGWSMFQQETSGCDAYEDADVDKYVQEHKNLGDTIIAVFSIDSTMGGATASEGKIHGKWVAKQESLHGGTQRLINTQWQYELEGFGNELDGISVVEDSWLRIVDAKEIGHPQLHAPLAVLQHVRRMEILFNGSQRMDRRHIRTVTELLKKQIIAELEFVDRELENTLMLQSLKLS